MPNPVKHFYEFGPFRLNAEKHRLTRDGEIIPLSRKDIESLLVLVRNPGKPLEREELLQAVWGDTIVEDGNLTVSISHLRKALETNGDAAEYIETIPRVGYRFVADVREATEERAPLIVEKRTLSRTVVEEEFVDDDPRLQEKTVASISRPRLTGPTLSFIKQHATASLIIFLALALALGALFYARANKPPIEQVAITSIRSIAVLPPRALTNDADSAPLSLGVADALITRLGGLRRDA